MRAGGNASSRYKAVPVPELSFQGAANAVNVAPSWTNFSPVESFLGLPPTVVQQPAAASWSQPAAPTTINAALKAQAWTPRDAAYQSASGAVAQNIALKMGQIHDLRQAAAKTLPTDEDSVGLGRRVMDVLQGQQATGSSALGEVNAGTSAQRQAVTLNRFSTVGSGRASWVPAAVASSRPQAKSNARVVSLLRLQVANAPLLVVAVTPALAPMGGVMALDLATRGNALLTQERAMASVAVAPRAVRTAAVVGRPVFQDFTSSFEPSADRVEERLVGMPGTAQGSTIETVSVLESPAFALRDAPRSDSLSAAQQSQAPAVRSQAQASSPSSVDLSQLRTLLTVLMPLAGLLLVGIGLNRMS